MRCKRTRNISLGFQLLLWVVLSASSAQPVRAAELHFFRNVEPMPTVTYPKLRAIFPMVAPIEKTDVVIVDSEVTIDDELDTNGGNVLIVANKLFINAPIDTRTRAVAIPPFWNVGPNQWDLATQFGPYVPEVMTPFFNWYFWYDAYSPATHSYAWVTGDRTAYDRGTSLLPLMPMGRVTPGRFYLPPWEGTVINGSPFMPPYDIEAFASGNITIFAHSIQFCSECRRTSLAGTAAPGGSEFDRNQVRFLNASGLPGGRGPLGSTFPRCMRAAQGRQFAIDCDSHNVGKQPGGLSTPSDEGSRGGTISVNIVNNDAFAKHEIAQAAKLRSCLRDGCPKTDFAAELGQSIVALSDARTGGLSYPGRVRTPSYDALIASHGNRAVFATQATQAEVAVYRKTWQTDVPGGLAVISNVSSPEALSQAALELSAFDSNPSYDLKKTLLWMVDPAHGTAHTVPFARDLLAMLLTQMLERRELQLLDSLEQSIFHINQEAAYSTDILSGIQCGQPIGLLGREVEILQRICMHETRVGPDLLRSYFKNAGGLLQSAQHSTFTESDLHLVDIAASLVRVQQDVQSLRVNVQSLTLIEHKRISQQQAQALQTDIGRMQANLDAAVAKMEEAQNAANQDILSRAIQNGKSLQGAFKELSAAIVSENYIAALPAIYEVGEGLVKFFSPDTQRALNDAADAGSSTVADLRGQVALLQQNYEAFLQQTKEAEDSIYSQRLDVSRSILEATHELQDEQLHVLVEFEDMLRAVLVAYVADKSTNLGQLPGQEQLIREIITNFQATPLHSLPNLGSSECGPEPIPPFAQLPPDKPIGCTFFNQQPGTTTLLSNQSERLPNFPVVVVTGGTGSFTVPMRHIYMPSSLHWDGGNGLAH